MCLIFYLQFLHWYFKVRLVFSFNLFFCAVFVRFWHQYFELYKMNLSLPFPPMFYDTLNKTSICFSKFLRKVFFKQWNANKVHQETSLQGLGRWNRRLCAPAKGWRKHFRHDTGHIQSVWATSSPRAASVKPYGMMAAHVDTFISLPCA